VQLIETVTGLNGRNLARLGQGLELTPEATADVLRVVIPELRRNMERETLSRGGLAQLIQRLGDSKQEEYLDDAVDLTTPKAVEHGNELLCSILHTKYQSRALADRAEKQTGIPADKIRRMLPRIANISMAALQEQTRSGLEDIFKEMPSFPDSQPSANHESPAGSSPLPIPADDWGGQSRNGYDDLSDVLRRKQRPLQSNPLWNIARQVLGSVLGFQSKGVIGYIIRFIVYRNGWSILRMVFGRLFRV
jgi:hypothetical protein